jgi:hypothetical protein
LREIRIKISEKDYLDFLKASNGYNLTIEEKIIEIINYVIIERKRMNLEKKKIRFKPLTCRISGNCFFNNDIYLKQKSYTIIEHAQEE